MSGIFRSDQITELETLPGFVKAMLKSNIEEYSILFGFICIDTFNEPLSLSLWYLFMIVSLDTPIRFAI